MKTQLYKTMIIEIIPFAGLLIVIAFKWPPKIWKIQNSLGNKWCLKIEPWMARNINSIKLMK